MTVTTHDLLDAVAAIMDAFVDVEAFAAFSQHQGTANPSKHPERVALGAAFAAAREENGTAALRADIIALAQVSEEVWASASDDDRDGITWDFDYCAQAAALRFASKLEGEPLRVALAEWIAAESARQTDQRAAA